jgi:hypothetical protein
MAETFYLVSLRHVTCCTLPLKSNNWYIYTWRQAPRYTHPPGVDAGVPPDSPRLARLRVRKRCQAICSDKLVSFLCGQAMADTLAAHSSRYCSYGRTKNLSDRNPDLTCSRNRKSVRTVALSDRNPDLTCSRSRYACPIAHKSPVIIRTDEEYLNKIKGV